MKILHLDCTSGAAGDMLAAALLDLFDDREGMVAKLNAIGVPEVEFALEDVRRCGIAARHLSVRVHGEEEGHGHGHEHGHHHHHHHHHRTLEEVFEIVDGLKLEPKVAENVREVFGLLGEAEAGVHGGSRDTVHFHEVGALDAVADIAAVSFLLNELAPDMVTATPVSVGAGTVRCAHGVMSVPAPCTAALLRGIPVRGGEESDGELCTPTGAALLRHFVGEFGQMKPMTPTKIGCGAGGKDLEGRANIVRAMLGETEEKSGQDVVCEFRCAIDDMTAEDLAFAAERVIAEGALDAVMVPALMKKGRPGTLLEVLCRPDDRDKIARCIFRHTTTIGLRETLTQRRVLARHEEEIATPLGIVRRKVSEGEGVRRIKAEHDDLAAAAMKMTAEDGAGN